MEKTHTKRCEILHCFDIPRFGQEGAKSAGEVSLSKTSRVPHEVTSLCQHMVCWIVKTLLILSKCVRD